MVKQAQLQHVLFQILIMTRIAGNQNGVYSSDTPFFFPLTQIWRCWDQRIVQYIAPGCFEETRRLPRLSSALKCPRRRFKSMHRHKRIQIPQATFPLLADLHVNEPLCHSVRTVRISSVVLMGQAGEKGPYSSGRSRPYDLRYQANSTICTERATCSDKYCHSN